MNPPIPDSYWVLPGQLLAGEYPGARLESQAAAKLARFRMSGITSFLDLTEAEEGLAPYEHLLAGARWLRMPIRDQGCPRLEEMRAILDRIDAELAVGRVVYVHCWGGHGRTGTVVGCWLVRQGTPPAEALSRIRELRRGVPDADWMASPETGAQRQLVLDWER